MVVDALIQLNAPVPSATLRNLAPDFETAAAILLARMPMEESGPLSLELYRSPVKPDFTLQYVSAPTLSYSLVELRGCHRQSRSAIRFWECGDTELRHAA